MANLTITVDGDVLKRARIRALERDESVNAYLARKLAEYAGPDPQADSIGALRDLADRVDASSGPGGRSWKRDDLHR